MQAKEISAKLAELWQPIETAPRDGTEILVWVNGVLGEDFVLMVRYLNGRWSYGPPIKIEDKQIHAWMPLPDV